MKKSLLIAIMLSMCGLAFLTSLNLGKGYEMGFSEIISKDTTWTKANSPYTLSGNVLISKGATLTIEAGVTVNCNKNVIQVNGTLKVRGSDTDKVIFTSTNTMISSAKEQLANINFGDESFGNIIENAIFHTMAWTYYNCKNSIIINKVTIKDGATPTSSGFVSVLPTIRGPGFATITNSIFTSGFQLAISAAVTNNTFSDAGISASDGTFTITNNTITGTKSPVQGYGISIERFQKAIISDNYISNYAEACIRLYDGPALIQRNFLESEPNRAGYPFFGIEIDGSSPIIQNNTITNTGIAICLRDSGVILAKPTIRNNNIYNNKNSNLFLGYPERPGYNTLDYTADSNIDASNNWWGTIDTDAINQSIRDSKYRSDLGTVIFTPFLTATNPQAVPEPNELTPTLQQIQATEFIRATKENGEGIDLTLNGNLTVLWSSKVSIIENSISSSTNLNLTIIADTSNTYFANITIPKSGIPYGNTPSIYLNTNPVQDQGFTQDEENYYVWLTNHFNNYFYGTLTIVFTHPFSPTNALIIGTIVAILLIAALAIVIWKKRRQRDHLFLRKLLRDSSDLDTWLCEPHKAESAFQR
ncbi:MAG: hypothetical protein NWE98_06615 [Candidatus Bathyarchaeota archaeon]|nr:hypothetical protein [Candidatus Bathyarchaeota archaeon]